MARPKKKPTVSLSALEHIPAVREALRFVGLEMVVVPAKHYAPATLTPEVLEASKARPGDVVVAQLDTPERREWLQQQAEVATALKEERAKTLPKPLAQLPKRQRDAIAEGFLVDASKKAGLMANFQHDGPPDGETILDKQPIETLSEVT